MKNSHYINGWLFQTKLFVLSILVTTSNSFSEETNLKINILNLDKPGVLYLSVCQDKESFERTVKESEEKNCIRASRGNESSKCSNNHEVALWRTCNHSIC